ncbi:MAG: twin-arginine translocation signal domain-containing protein, partial [Calditrichaeota bacterium]
MSIKSNPNELNRRSFIRFGAAGLGAAAFGPALSRGSEKMSVSETARLFVA